MVDRADCRNRTKGLLVLVLADSDGPENVAFVPGRVLRVDPGHDTTHHRHGFGLNGVETLPAVHFGLSRPNLGEVLDELHVYWTRKR